ncbi:hypothetical protein MRB53_037056 [Persea americana]|nr:hypothetical protein MRB53_037056 [Persea americana]
MGRTVSDLDPRDERSAMDAIDCYILGIDMTARNVQDEAKRNSLPWSIAKGFDTFLPVSSPISRSLIPDPYQARLWLNVDDEKRQDDKAELMLFRIPRILSDISRVMRLEEGDIVLTGTPKGVGKVGAGQRMTAGLSVDGREVEEAGMQVDVVESGSGYAFTET